MQLNNILVPQLAKGLNLFGYHMRVLGVRREVEHLDSHISVDKFIMGEVHRPKSTLAKFAFHFDEFHSHLMVKGFA